MAGLGWLADQMENSPSVIYLGCTERRQRWQLETSKGHLREDNWMEEDNLFGGAVGGEGLNVAIKGGAGGVDQADILENNDGTSFGKREDERGDVTLKDDEEVVHGGGEVGVPQGEGEDKNEVLHAEGGEGDKEEVLHEGGCHCGTVRWRVRAARLPTGETRDTFLDFKTFFPKSSAAVLMKDQ